MSPADPLPAEPSPSDANTATKTERGESKKRDSAAILESHTSNGTEPKEKKRKKKHDPPRTQNGKEATADETTDVAPEPLPKSPSKVQVPDDGIPEQSGEKKRKKNKKEKREDAQQETVASHVDDGTKDEKKAKKRKHKEKREKDAQADQDSAAKEGATELEPVALQTDDTKGKKNKKGKEEKAGVEVAVATDQATSENRKHEDLVVNGGEEKRKRKRKKTTEEGS